MKITHKKFTPRSYSLFLRIKPTEDWGYCVSKMISGMEKDGYELDEKRTEKFYWREDSADLFDGGVLGMTFYFIEKESGSL